MLKSLMERRLAWMRLEVTLTAGKPVSIPVQYNYFVQGLIYEHMEQPALRNFLHEHGFEIGKRRFKLFTFSRLIGSCHFDRNTNSLIFQPPIKLIISSPVNMIIQEIGNGLLRQGTIHIGRAWLNVAKIKREDPIVSSRSVVMRMLSPVTVYSTLVSKEKHYTYYYSPFEERFQDLIRENLARKYLLVFGHQADSNGFGIKPLKLAPSDHKILNYKGFIIQGWMGDYQLTGDPQLLEMALGAGLGSKNSQGFGCCDVAGN